MTPAQLRALAAFYRERCAVPGMWQTQQEYLFNTVMQTMADGLDHLAEQGTPKTLHVHIADPQPDMIRALLGESEPQPEPPK